MKFLATYNIVLAAYSSRALAVTGSMLEVDTSTAPFLMTIDDGEEFEIRQGYRLTEQGDAFTRLFLRNNTASEITIKLYVGSRLVSFAPSTLNVQTTNAATAPAGSGILSDAAKTYSGLNPADSSKTRKLFTLTNLDDTSYVDLTDGTDKLLMRVFAGQSKGIETGGTVKVVNTFGIEFCVGEVFYS